MLEPDDSYVDDLQDLIIESEAHPERRLAIFLDYWERARKVDPQKASYASLLYSLAKGESESGGKHSHYDYGASRQP